MYNQSAAGAVGLTDCRIMKLLFKVIVYIANTAVLSFIIRTLLGPAVQRVNFV